MTHHSGTALMDEITNETWPTDVTEANLSRTQSEGFHHWFDLDRNFWSIIERKRTFADYIREIRAKYGHDNVRLGVPIEGANPNRVSIYVRRTPNHPVV